ncbi:MAG: tRNA lysidine(34) synthetase TilS [bacterium]|nr:tRNA lysidine(34) synthetase TilS [bacterium]
MAGSELSAALFAEGAIDADVLSAIDAQGSCILAVSGGRDSMLLLYLFRELFDQGYLQREPVVFHLNHGLRASARDDLDFVARQARRLEFAFYFQERDAARFARRTKTGLEEAGRLLRYRALGRLRSLRAEGGLVITAHHADDYLESVLIHLIRGGGPGAMNTLSFFSRVENTPVARPLVLCTRERIASLVQAHDIPFVEDPSNRSPEFLRNRLRQGPAAALLGEGLDPVKLWRNFHDDPRDTMAAPENINARPAYLSIDRRILFGDPLRLSECKQIFDLAFRRLGLPPADRKFLAAIRTQLRRGADFRVSFRARVFRVWSDARGPVWIFRSDAPALRAPTWERGALDPSAAGVPAGSTQWVIRFCGRTREVLCGPNERPAVFRPGMRVRLADGSRVSVRKLLREAGVPAPVREFLPLIVEGRPRAAGSEAEADLNGAAPGESAEPVTRICFGFWESLRDRRFFNLT